MVYTARKTYRTAASRKRSNTTVTATAATLLLQIVAVIRRQRIFGIVHVIGGAGTEDHAAPRILQCLQSSISHGHTLAFGVHCGSGNQQNGTNRHIYLCVCIVGATKKIPFLMSRKESEQRQGTRQTTPDSCCCCCCAGSQWWLLLYLFSLWVEEIKNAPIWTGRQSLPRMNGIGDHWISSSTDDSGRVSQLACAHST